MNRKVIIYVEWHLVKEHIEYYKTFTEFYHEIQGRLIVDNIENEFGITRWETEEWTITNEEKFGLFILKYSENIRGLKFV